MSHDQASVATMPRGTGKLAIGQVRQLLIASAIAIALTGCGGSAGRDVRAYDACMSRHPQEAALCEGPRQAYEVDTSTFQAKAAAISAPAGGDYQELSDGAHPTPAPLRPMPIASRPNG